MMDKMEDFIVSGKEHKLYKKFRKYLESFYKVKICMPKVDSLDSDIVFISLCGEETCRDGVKKFVSEKMKLHSQNHHFEGNALVVTLSDSEEESTSTDEDDFVPIVESSSKSKESVGSQSGHDESVLIIESPKSPIYNTSQSNENSDVLGDDSICIIENPKISRKQQCQAKRRKGMKKNIKKVRSNVILCSSDAEASELCEVTSTTNDMAKSENSVWDESKPLSEATASVQNSLDFIPLFDVSEKNECDKNTFNRQLSKRNKEGIIPVVKSCSLRDKNSKACTLPSTQNKRKDEEIVIIEKPLSNVIPRSLRPIVIDGSNIAREHGRASVSFSAKGIQLAVDYFVNRGHTQVTAFLPMYRRHFNPKRSNVQTTNPEIIEELAKKQFVVFTPSRRVNGKCFQSYDDRFIVQLAAKNGGVIVSNDNFRDLLTENDSFKEAIEQRLLMYCFVGDEFMVPDDPLGRTGPKLDEFLSFPLENTEK